jgi:hypothetical protein
MMSRVVAVVAPLCFGTWIVAERAVRALLSVDLWGRVALLVMPGMIILGALLIASGVNPHDSRCQRRRQRMKQYR